MNKSVLVITWVLMLVSTLASLCSLVDAFQKDDQRRTLALSSSLIVLAIFAFFALQWWFRKRISRDEANRTRALLALTTDQDVVSSSRHKTAIASHVVEIRITEDYRTFVWNWLDRLRGFAEIAEANGDPSEQAVKDMRSSLTKLLEDKKYIDSHHIAFKLLPIYSRKPEEWQAFRNRMNLLDREIRIQLLGTLGYALKENGSENARQKRRRKAFVGTALAASQLIDDFLNPAVDFLTASAKETRTHLLKLF